MSLPARTFFIPVALSRDQSLGHNKLHVGAENLLSCCPSSDTVAFAAHREGREQRAVGFPAQSISRQAAKSLIRAL